MPLSRALAAVGRVSLLAVLLLAAVNTVLSLYRWEWQRAVIAAVFLVGAMVVLATLLVLRRLAALETRLTELAEQRLPAADPAPAAVDETPFPWLAPPPGSTSVFLPILLGFGVLLSLLALVVERVAAFALGPAPTDPAAARTPDRPGRPRARVHAAAGVVVTVLLGVLLALMVPDLADDLITRDEQVSPGVRTYVLQVRARRDLPDPVGSATSLLTYCRARVNEPTVEIRSVRLQPDGTVRAVVSPLLGPFKARSFEGCLRDLVLDRRRVEVLSVQPPAGRPGQPVAGAVQSRDSTVAPS